MAKYSVINDPGKDDKPPTADPGPAPGPGPGKPRQKTPAPNPKNPKGSGPNRSVINDPGKDDKPPLKVPEIKLAMKKISDAEAALKQAMDALNKAINEGRGPKPKSKSAKA